MYIIDGENGEIIRFDPVTKLYTKKINIPEIGRYPCAVVISNKIYILYGRENKKYYLIYDITQNKLTQIAAKEAFDALFTVSLATYQQQLIAFGSFNNTQSQYRDSVIISSRLEQDGSDKHEIKWRDISEET